MRCLFVFIVAAGLVGCGQYATVDVGGPAVPRGDAQEDPVQPTVLGTSSSGADTDDMPVPGNFLGFRDFGTVSYQCNLWTQNCPEGEKCTTYANDGGNAPNATKCVAIHPQPDAVGDPCWSEESWTGVDSCEFGSFCWDMDPETGIGLCVAFCSGTESDPYCEDPRQRCSIGKEFSLCLPDCDPLEKDCPVGCACYGIDQAFVCAPDASGDMGEYGDPCEFLNACSSGLACANAAGVPGCTGASGCCTPYCDLNNDVPCPGEAGGQTCVSWFEEGAAPPGYDNTGVCFIPQ